MATCIASTFSGAAVPTRRPAQRRAARSVAVVPRAALEAQRMATPFDGYK